jgi:hypothetical protein
MDMVKYVKFGYLFLILFLTLVETIGAAALHLYIKPLPRGVELSWDREDGVEGYVIYRSESRFGEYQRLTPSPILSASLIDKEYRYAYYKISEWNHGGEGNLSAPQSLEMELFGPGTIIFSPGDFREEVQKVIDDISRALADGRKSQFTEKRQAFLFKPGNYDWLRFEIGFYMQVAGLGKFPTDTRIDKITVSTDWLGGRNATCNFWRTAENLTLLNQGDTLIFGVSQAAPLRRMMIHGSIIFDMGGWASGGYLANSVVQGTAGSATQQQFFLRNNELTFNGVNWNLVAVGNSGEIHTKSALTNIPHTPVIYEKPFIFLEKGEYSVFIPGCRSEASGSSWNNGKSENGMTIPLSRFYIAHADRDDANTLNAALNQGKNILFTPGIYEVTKTLNVHKKNTILLGLGLATIRPTQGNIAMQTGDLEGIRIAGLIFDAGSGVAQETETKGSPVLLRVGNKGSGKKLNRNPIVLSDLFFRIGGVQSQLPCRADISLEINSNNTIGDHFWIWRADHGAQVGWELNKAGYGLVVNGKDVTIYGLFVEHFQKYETWWMGERGKTYFYRNEKAYDVPTQQDWIGPDNHLEMSTF